MLNGGSAKMRSANGLVCLLSISMQSSQMILLMRLLIGAYYRIAVGFQGILRVLAGEVVAVIFFYGVCTGH